MWLYILLGVLIFLFGGCFGAFLASFYINKKLPGPKGFQQF